MVSGDPGRSQGVLAIGPVPLRTRTLSMEPRRIRLRAIASDPYPSIFSRGRAPRDLASIAYHRHGRSPSGRLGEGAVCQVEPAQRITLSVRCASSSYRSRVD